MAPHGAHAAPRLGRLDTASQGDERGIDVGKKKATGMSKRLGFTDRATINENKDIIRFNERLEREAQGLPPDEPRGPRGPGRGRAPAAGERPGRPARPPRVERPVRPPALDEEQVATLRAAYLAVVGESGLEPAAEKVLEQLVGHASFERATMAGWELASGGHAEDRTAEQWELLRAAWLALRVGLLEAYVVIKPDAQELLDRERKQQARLAKPQRPRRRPAAGGADKPPRERRPKRPTPAGPRPPSPAALARMAAAGSAAVPAAAEHLDSTGSDAPAAVQPTGAAEASTATDTPADAATGTPTDTATVGVAADESLPADIRLVEGATIEPATDISAPEPSGAFAADDLDAVAASDVPAAPDLGGAAPPAEPTKPAEPTEPMGATPAPTEGAGDLEVHTPASPAAETAAQVKPDLEPEVERHVEAATAPAGADIDSAPAETGAVTAAVPAGEATSAADETSATIDPVTELVDEPASTPEDLPTGAAGSDDAGSGDVPSDGPAGDEPEAAAQMETEHSGYAAPPPPEDDDQLTLGF